MSNLIWKKPDQKPERNEDILVEYTSTNGQSYYIVDSYLNELLHPKRWAYLSDIIDQADKAKRLQKAVDLALNVMGGLKSALTHVGHTGEALAADINEIELMIKENQ